jgi:predicted Zn-dependent peptidase
VAALAAGLSLIATPAPAVVDLSKVPTVGTPRDFTPPARDTVQLPNGLRISFIPFGVVPKVSLVAVVRTGNIDDGAQPGLADMTANLMAEGAGDRDGPTLDRYVAGMGGSLSVSSGGTQFSVSLDVLAERGPDAAAVVADVLRRPRLPAAELERLRSDMARNVSISRSQAQTVASEAYATLLYGDHPYGRGLPSDAVIAGYRLEDLQHFVSTQLGAARTHLYVAGQFDRTRMEAALREALGDWAAGTPATVIPPLPPFVARVKLIDRPEAPQSTLSLGLPVISPSHPDWMALQVANSLLGGAFFSRITLNIREAKGYAYSPASSLSPQLGATDWSEDADVTREETANALREVYREIERLQTEAAPQDELQRNQNLLIGRLALSVSTRQGLVSRLSFLDLHGLPDHWLANYVSAVRAVTPARLTEVFRTHLDPTRMSLVVVGDMSKVRESVKALPQVQVLPET